MLLVVAAAQFSSLASNIPNLPRPESCVGDDSTSDRLSGTLDVLEFRLTCLLPSFFSDLKVRAWDSPPLWGIVKAAAEEVGCG